MPLLSALVTRVKLPIRSSCNQTRRPWARQAKSPTTSTHLRGTLIEANVAEGNSQQVLLICGFMSLSLQRLEEMWMAVSDTYIRPADQHEMRLSSSQALFATPSPVGFTLAESSSHRLTTITIRTAKSSRAVLRRTSCRYQSNLATTCISKARISPLVRLQSSLWYAKTLAKRVGR